MNKLLVLIGLVLLVSVQTVYAKVPPPGTGSADVKANIVFLLDISGSMGSNVPTVYEEIYHLAIDSDGYHWCLVYDQHEVRKIDISDRDDIKLVGKFGRDGNNGVADDTLDNPKRIIIRKDPHDGDKEKVYISDYGSHRVNKYKMIDGLVPLSFEKSFSVREPGALEVDSKGNIYVFSEEAQRVIKLDKDGVELARWDPTPGPGNEDGAVSLSIYEGPKQPPAENDDFVYSVGSDSPTDPFDYRVRKHDLDGNLILSKITIWDHQADLVVTDDGVYKVSSYPVRHDYSSRKSRHRKLTKLSHELEFLGHVGCFSRAASTRCWRDVRSIAEDPSTGNVVLGDHMHDEVKVYTPAMTYVESIPHYRSNRMDAAKKVMKAIVSENDLVRGANFGMITWADASTTKVEVPVAVDGAQDIYDYMDLSGCRCPGGSTKLDLGMIEARNYLRGPTTPIDASAGCQKTFLIVISDGEWGSNPENVAKDLLNANGIKSFIIGIYTGGNANYVTMAKAGGTYPDSPLYTNNWEHLYATLASYIRQSISSRLTFTTPFIMPSVTGDDHIFQSTFTYMPEHQWEGKLEKWKIKEDGDIGNMVWEAGTLLNARSPSDRKIWTIGSGLPTGLNNFTLSQKTALQPLMWDSSGKNPTDAQVENLINFVRGFDAFDEDGDSAINDKRWMLADIYHSQIAVVGPPVAETSDEAADSHTEAYYRHKKGYKTFKELHAKRQATVYAGANDGMLHAFDSKTGRELWAFIPPAMLPRFHEMEPTRPNTSVAIYGVDGSPVVRDVFYQNKWITMLIAGMGQGAKSYFALDVSYRDAPKFLFAFGNNPVDEEVYHWSSTGSKTTYEYISGVPADYDYSKLGDAVSIPTIVLAKTSGAKKYVAAIGAGFNAGVNPEYASAIYVIDIGNEGKVIQRLDLPDNPGGYANALPTQLTAITPDTTGVADYSGAMLYAVDLETKEHKLNLTDRGPAVSVAHLFDGDGTISNGRSNHFAVTPSIGTDGKLWIYFATGDQLDLHRMTPPTQNRIYGIRDSNFPEFRKVPMDVTSNLKNVTGAGSLCPTAADSGWYKNLSTNEKVTGKIAVHNEVLYVSRYTPNNLQICYPGNNLLSEIGFGCGKTQKDTELGAGILTGAVVFKDKIYIGVSGATGNTGGSPASGYKQHGNIIVGRPAYASDNEGAVTRESWREIY